MTPGEPRFRRLLGDIDAVCRNTVGPAAADVDRQARHPVESWKALAPIGGLRLRVPEKEGGLGLDPVAYVTVIERIARWCAATAMTVHMHSTACDMIAGRADDGVRRQLFALVVEEDAMYGSWGSEPSTSPSRSFVSVTTARQDTHGFVIDGEKNFCTMAGHVGRALVHLSIDPGDGSPAQMGTLVVPTDTPGVEIDSDWDPMGMRGTVSPTVRFVACRVPPEAHLVRTAPGESPARGSSLEQLSIGFAAVMLGSATGALSALGRHLQGRVLADGLPALVDDPVVQRAVGGLVAPLDAARLALWAAVERWAAEPVGATVAVAQAKYVVTVAARAATVGALGVGGGTAAQRDVGVERALRDVHTASLMPPNIERMRQVAGAAFLSGRAEMLAFGQQP
jgi:alkylation response protein AidB-like acyl-CoA dehydrogenase